MTGGAGEVVERDGECGLVLRPRRTAEGADTAGAPLTSGVGGGFDVVVPSAPFWTDAPRVAPERARGADGRSRPGVDSDIFRAAMSRFPSGVTIVTTTDRQGRPWGFTASAFCALSLDPPLVLVCLDRAARCHPVFMAAERFAVSFLRPGHWGIALRFASKEADKFGGGEFTTDEQGLARLPDALASVVCETERRVPAGDHTILIGRAVSATVGEGEPALFFDRRPWRIHREEGLPAGTRCARLGS